MDEKEKAVRTIDEYIARFPYCKPVPYNLIAEIVRFRVDENTRDAQIKNKTEKAK